jgi:hypothetical protein
MEQENNETQNVASSQENITQPPENSTVSNTEPIKNVAQPPKFFRITKKRIVIAVLFAVACVIYAYIAHKLNKIVTPPVENTEVITTPETTESVTIPPKHQPEATDFAPIYEKMAAVEAWKPYYYEQGGYKIDIPQGYVAQHCYGMFSGLFNCVAIADENNPELHLTEIKAYGKNHGHIEWMTNKGYTTNELNFNIPTLSQENNAHYSLNENYPVVTFTNRGVVYFVNHLFSVPKFNTPVNSKMATIIKKIAQSFEPTNNTSTCTHPTYVPITDFPEHFTLIDDRVISDESDSINTVSPYTSSSKHPSARYVDESFLDQFDNSAMRAFITKYKKIGEAEIRDRGIHGFTQISKDLLTERTEHIIKIWHVNCAYEELDRPIDNQPYHIGTYDAVEDPFAVDIYTDSRLNSSLDSAEQWNLDLVKEARREIYVKRDNVWQKYEAFDYAVTAPCFMNCANYPQ